MPATQEKSKNAEHSKYVDFDEFIEFQLRKTRSGIHQTDLLWAGMVLLAVLVAYLLLFSLADHWLVPGGLSDGWRLALMGAMLIGSLAWLGWKIVLPWMKQINSLYAAREIEKAHPEFRSSLLTWVSFRDAGRPVSPAILKAIEKRTALQMSHADVDDAVDRRPLMRTSYLLLALVVVLCLYTLVSPKKMSTTVWRALFPTSSVAAATRTEIQKVTPGDTEILARDQVDITADLGGQVPEEVTLFYSTADRRFVDEPLRMQRADDDLPRYRTRLTGEGGQGLLNDVTYYVAAGDARSPEYRIRVNQPPSAAVTEVQYDYPRYMGLPVAVQQESTIDAWEGTRVTIRATPNMPVKRAVVYCTDQESPRETAESYPMGLRGDVLEASWQLKFRDVGDHARFYFVQVWNERDQKDPRPTMHRIKIREDLKPEITLIHPTEPLTAPQNSVVPIAFGARDPDFLLRRVSLRLDHNGERLPVPPPLFEGPPDVAEFRHTYRLDLSILAVKPGDNITFHIEAEDNFEPFGKRLRNVSYSPKVTITISEPEAQEQADNFTREQDQKIREQIQPQDPNRNPQQSNQEPDRQQRARDPQEQRPDEPNPENQEPGNQQERMNDASNGEQSGEDGSEGGQSGQSTESQPSRQPGDSNQSGQQESSGEPGDSGEAGDQTEGTQQAGDGDRSSQDPSRQSQPGGSNRGSGENSPQRTPSGQQNQPGTQPNGNQGQSDPSQSGSGNRQSAPRKDKAPEDEALEELLRWSEDQNDQQQESGEQRSGDQDQSNGETGEQPTPADETGSDPDAANPDRNQRGDQSQQDSTQPGQESNSSDGNQPGSEQPPSGSQPENSNQQPSDSGQQQSESGQQSQTGQQSGAESSESGQQGTGQNGEQSQSGESGSEQNPAGMNGNEASESSSEDPRDQQNSGNSNPPSDSSNQSGQDGQMERSPADSQQSGQPAERNEGSNSEGDAQPGGDPENAQQSSGEQRSPDGANGERTPAENQTPNGDEPVRPADPNSSTPPQQGPQSSQEGQDSGQQGPPGDQTPSSDSPSGNSSSQSGQSGSQSDSSSENASSSSESSSSSSSESGTSGSEQQTGSNSGQQSSSSGESQSGNNAEGESGNSNQTPGEKNGEQTANSGETGQQQSGDSQEQENGGQPSGSQTGEDPAGAQSGEGGTPGEGNQSQQGQQGSQNGTPSQNSPSDSTSTPSGSGGAAGPSDNASPVRDQSSSGEGGEGGNMTPEEAVLENRKKAVNLALKRLREQLERGESPDDLQKQLGYTDEEMMRFMERLEERLSDPGLDQSAESAARRRQFESILRGIDYKSQGESRSGGDHEREASQGFSAGEGPVPPAFRRSTEGFRRKLNSRDSSR